MEIRLYILSCLFYLNMIVPSSCFYSEGNPLKRQVPSKCK